jgi:hypothetical protein
VAASAVFLWGVLVVGEAVPAVRWAGFVLV